MSSKEKITMLLADVARLRALNVVLKAEVERGREAFVLGAMAMTNGEDQKMLLADTQAALRQAEEENSKLRVQLRDSREETRQGRDAYRFADLACDERDKLLAQKEEKKFSSGGRDWERLVSTVREATAAIGDLETRMKRSEMFRDTHEERIDNLERVVDGIAIRTRELELTVHPRVVSEEARDGS